MWLKHSNFRKFPDYAVIIYRKGCMREIGKLWINKRTLTPFKALGARSEGKYPKN
jgi:hypothetical protein